MKLAAFVLSATALFAGWEDVQRLTADQKVEVFRRKADSVTGRFVSATETAVVVKTSSGEQTLTRDTIRRVNVADSSRRARNTAIGAAVGAAAGFAIGWAVCPGCANEGAGGKYTGPAAAAGAGIGAAAGLLSTGYRTIYKSK